MKRTNTISLKRMFRFIIVLMIALFFGGLWYSVRVSMQDPKVLKVHSPSLDKALCVATQVSAGKDAVTAGIVQNYERNSVYIKATNISDRWDSCHGGRC